MGSSFSSCTKFLPTDQKGSYRTSASRAKLSAGASGRATFAPKLSDLRLGSVATESEALLQELLRASRKLMDGPPGACGWSDGKKGGPQVLLGEMDGFPWWMRKTHQVFPRNRQDIFLTKQPKKTPMGKPCPKLSPVNANCCGFMPLKFRERQPQARSQVARGKQWTPGDPKHVERKNRWAQYNYA